MARLQLARKRSEVGRGRLVGPLAGFAVLCGLLLLVLGAPGPRCGIAAEQAATRQILTALKAINQVERDLEAGNYGNARANVQSAQQALTEALTELQAAPAPEP